MIRTPVHSIISPQALCLDLQCWQSCYVVSHLWWVVRLVQSQLPLWKTSLIRSAKMSLTSLWWIEGNSPYRMLQTILSVVYNVMTTASIPDVSCSFSKHFPEINRWYTYTHVQCGGKDTHYTTQRNSNTCRNQNMQYEAIEIQTALEATLWMRQK